MGWYSFPSFLHPRPSILNRTVIAAGLLLFPSPVPKPLLSRGCVLQRVHLTPSGCLRRLRTSVSGFPYRKMGNKKSLHPIRDKSFTSAVPPKLVINYPLFLRTIMRTSLITVEAPVGVYSQHWFQATLSGPFGIVLYAAFAPPAALWDTILYLLFLFDGFRKIFFSCIIW